MSVKCNEIFGISNMDISEFRNYHRNFMLNLLLQTITVLILLFIASERYVPPLRGDRYRPLLLYMYQYSS